jgi:DNA-binding response OmpR family regulator
MIMKVAFVEDDPSYRQILTEFLDDQDYQVDSAEHPSKLYIERIEDYDAFIMDVQMGNDRTAGIDFIYKIHQENHLNPKALVIFISNFGTEDEDIQKRLEQIRNFLEYRWLDKPVNLVLLEQMLRLRAEE